MLFGSDISLQSLCMSAFPSYQATPSKPDVAYNLVYSQPLV